MSDVALRLRSRWQPREWPRYRDGAERDERAWLDGLSDRELAEHCAALGQIDKAVKDFRGIDPSPEIRGLLENEA